MLASEIKPMPIVKKSRQQREEDRLRWWIQNLPAIPEVGVYVRVYHPPTPEQEGWISARWKDTGPKRGFRRKRIERWYKARHEVAKRCADYYGMMMNGVGLVLAVVNRKTDEVVWSQTL